MWLADFPVERQQHHWLEVVKQQEEVLVGEFVAGLGEVLDDEVVAELAGVRVEGLVGGLEIEKRFVGGLEKTIDPG